MSKSEFLKEIFELYQSKNIDDTAYEKLADFADENFYDEEHDSRFPRWYAEIEYDDMESEEATIGARFDVMNFLRYYER